MKVTKKHWYHTFDKYSFHECDCDHCGSESEGSDALENLGDKIGDLLSEGYEVDLYLVKRKVK